MLFNALPSSIVSGVVHFITILMLALATFSTAVDNKTLQISAPPPEAIEEVEELKEEKIEIKVDETMVSNERSEVIAQVMQNVVEPTEVPSVAMDVDAAPIAVELSDFGQETAPKNDLMATVGAYTGSGVSGRGAAQQGANGGPLRRQRRQPGRSGGGAQVVRRSSEPRRQLELRSSARSLPGPLCRCGLADRLQNGRDRHGFVALPGRGPNAQAGDVCEERAGRSVLLDQPNEG
jgi:hypothetical protein